MRGIHDLMSAAEETPYGEDYVSLLDRLRALGKLLDGIGGQIVGPGELQHIVTGLAVVLEHGDEALNATTVDELEKVVTPQRPDGWNDPNARPADPRDAEIENLRARLAESQQSQRPHVPDTSMTVTSEPAVPDEPTEPAPRKTKGNG